MYADDRMFLGKSECQLSNIVNKLQDVGLDTDGQGHPSNYGVVIIQKNDDGSYKFTQCALIDSIIKDAGLSFAKVTTKHIPAAVQKPLHTFKDSPYFHNDFNYCSVVGKLIYIAQTTWPGIIYAIHQCACFSYDPCQKHGEAIMYLVRNLLKTHHLEIKFTTDQTKSFECYVDADFCGNWDK